MTSYSYCVLRYVHDPSAGEQINVGVLIYAPEAGFVRLLSDHRTRPLSQMFRGFDRDSFLRFTGWLEHSVENISGSLDLQNLRLFDIENAPEDAGQLAKKLLPDNGLSFQFGSVGGGVSRDLKATSEQIFSRMVSSQRFGKIVHKRRGDEAVWGTFHAQARMKGIIHKFSKHTVTTPEFPITLEHAFKNGSLHAVETLSLDYADSDSIQRKATEWLGNGLMLGLNPQFGNLYFLLGEPELDSQKSDFIKAQNMLRRLPIKPKIYRENEAEEMVEEIAVFLDAHGSGPDTNPL